MSAPALVERDRACTGGGLWPSALRGFG